MQFTDIIGQDFAAKVLKRSVSSESVSHAYLFVGLEGVGKTTTSLAFASALNCENRAPDGEPCGECWSCRAIIEGRHPDVELIAPETEQTLIEQMREMRRRAQYRPIRSPWKIIIIEQADSLNEDSASAILKILEEPPSYAVMMLLAKSMSSVLPTIASRCQAVRFRQSSMEILRTELMERFGASEEKADFLARYSEGRPGAAISLLNDEDFFTRRDAILDLALQAASTPKSHALRLAEDFRKSCATAAKAPKKSKTSRSAKTEDEESDAPAASAKTGSRKDLRQGLDSLILWYRDLLSLSLAGQNAPIVNVDKKMELSQGAAGLDLKHTRRVLSSLLWAKRAIEGNANTQLITEVLMMRMLRG
ncbi:MAG: DNA polymerase III subunit delta' [Armatimonadota bacterium]|nr:DNA polymerase III subunit delta' [Armatimonadota bacterium]